MAEAYLNHAGAKNWRAFSAGSKPAGKVNPFAIETLAAHGVDACGTLRSKSWDEFSSPSAPVMNDIVTVCDNAAGETCPAWPSRNGGAPNKLHWSFPDPAAVEGDDETKRHAFETVFKSIAEHIDALIVKSNA